MGTMETSRILDEISRLTSELAGNYPEIFRSLEEEPFVMGNDFQSVTENDMDAYMDSKMKLIYSY